MPAHASTPVYEHVMMNRAGDDTYQYRPDVKGMSVHAITTNTSGSDRAIFWRPSTPATIDATSCATWTSQSGAVAQQGIALRIRNGAQVTVTKNVWLGAYWIFNVHEWLGGYFKLLGGVDLAAVFRGPDGRARPLPWRICARVTGPTLTFKAWRIGEHPPQWGDGTHSGTMRLDPAYVYPGQPGWYVGHLGPGQDARYDSLHVA